MVIQRMPFIRRPGEAIAYHTHWIFPIEATSPVKLMEHLRGLGFDSINGYSSFIIPDPPPQHPGFEARDAREMMERVLYLPVHNGLSDQELDRLADAVTEFELAEREKLLSPTLVEVSDAPLVSGGISKSKPLRSAPVKA
jgi:dTDP-4-amino-4,6-dideoxygalactose transaminase